jgi:hypothetical protein
LRQELDPSHIVQTSDFIDFAGLRVVIRQNPKTVAMDQEVEAPRFFGSAIGLENSVGVFRFAI